jgi:hypothetical protein
VSLVLKNELEKWIDDPDAIDDLAVLEIFSEKDAAAGLFGAMNNQGVPIGNDAETMKINGGEDVRYRGLYNVEASVDLNLLASQSSVDAEISSGVYEEFLQDLHRHNTSFPLLMLQ